MFTVVFACVIAGIVMAITNSYFFDEVYVKEDGPIEWGTFVALVIGAAVCFRRAVVLRSRRRALFIVFTILLGLMFVFGAGEEISWGKRIFGFQSPEWFKEHNTQQDLTVHNLVVGHTRLNKVVFSQGIGVVLVVYVIVLPFLYRRNRKVARLVDSLALPLPRPRHVVAILALLVLVYGCVMSSYKGELGEFSLSWMVTLAFMFPFNAAAFSPRAEPLGG